MDDERPGREKHLRKAKPVVEKDKGRYLAKVRFLNAQDVLDFSINCSSMHHSHFPLVQESSRASSLIPLLLSS